MSSKGPTLINLPPPPSSDAITPSDVPGTPNSTTTSMSELSTVAIKDGHRGHLPHHQNPMDAERADRISRLAGLERVGAPGTTAPRNPSNLGPAGWPAQSQVQTTTPAYFDQNNNPQIIRERSTVGSASATGSVGGRTTWASGSDVYDPDKMSEDQDIPVSVNQDGDAEQMEADTTSSVGGFSDEQSLVGFGEGARTPARTHSAAGGLPVSPLAGKNAPIGSTLPGHARGDQFSVPGSTGMSGLRDQHVRMADGPSYDANTSDATARALPQTGAGSGRDPTAAEQAESILRERLGRDTQAPGGLQPGGASNLGTFPFEGQRRE